jgi:hypothetical protein
VDASICQAGETHVLAECKVFLFCHSVDLDAYVGQYVRIRGWVVPSPECDVVNVTALELATAPTATVTPTPSCTPTATATCEHTPPPAPTLTATPSPTPTHTTQPVCDCSYNRYNCSDFATQWAAQQCFDHCWDVRGDDIHRLDSDGDGIACEALP